MISIFSCPKAFRGHIGVIQRNAIGSWPRLNPPCEVILFGDEEGTAEVAKEFGVLHRPDVERNEYGTPLLSGIFATIDATARYETCAFINCDVMLMDDFAAAVTAVRALASRFLMVGECWNAPITAIVPFEPGWQAETRHLLGTAGASRGLWFIDYFVYSKRLYHDMPAFAVGRAAFDNWLVWQARHLGVPVVDASRQVTAVHQNHDYTHVKGGWAWSYHGEEATRNKELAGGASHLYSIIDASHTLRAGAIKPVFGASIRLKYRRHAFLVGMLGRTGALRKALGLHGQRLDRIRAFMGRRRLGPRV